MRPKLSVEEAKAKIYRYCAYQERCHQEVKQKLYDMGLFKNQVDEMLTHLITEGFLNEERFAKAFAGGKFRMKQWGRIKITHALEQRGLTPACIRLGLKAIDDQEYYYTLEKLLAKKNTQLLAGNDLQRRDRLIKYLMQKGYESELIVKKIKEMNI
jgi:regulatory protein